MEVNIQTEQKTVTVTLLGRLDTPASLEVAKEMDALKGEASKTIILDCSQMSYISSSGLRIFLTLRKNAATHGGRVVIRGLSNEVRSVFMMTGFLNLFEFE